jgi:hypothetical protein
METNVCFTPIRSSILGQNPYVSVTGVNDRFRETLAIGLMTGIGAQS